MKRGVTLTSMLRVAARYIACELCIELAIEPGLRNAAAPINNLQHKADTMIENDPARRRQN